MNDPGFLEKLLDGGTMEWLPLGAVTKYEQPTKYRVNSTEYSNDFETPVLTAGKTFILGFTDEIEGICNASLNPVIIFDDFTTANKWVDFDFKVKSSAMKLVRSSDNSRFILRYIFHWLNTLPSGLVDGNHKRQWISNFCNKRIPTPCPDNPEKSLVVQAEIVRILDAFNELTTELTKELTTRKKQYNYYRDQLLTFDNSVDVTWKHLGKIAEFKRGSSITKQNVIDGDIPVVAGGRKPAYFHNVSNREGETIVIAGSGAYAGFVSWWERPIFVSDAFTVKVNNEVLPKYCYYWLQSQQQRLHGLKSGGGVPHVYPRDVSPLLIPIPCLDNRNKSLAEQARIVAILDKFDTLTTSLSEGLPREIELRQKQYTYYRDLLFNFPKPDENVT